VRVTGLQFPQDTAFTARGLPNPLPSVEPSLPDRQPVTKVAFAKGDLGGGFGIQNSPDGFLVGHAMYGD
jgi:hypothetical protein